jgi:hypothetical protein
MEENRFKHFLSLEKERKKKNNEWSHNEDLNLLRGYQVYGEKWPMINVFFLPHRQRKEIRSRWSSLVKESLREYSKDTTVKNFTGKESTGISYLEINL